MFTCVLAYKAAANITQNQTAKLRFALPTPSTSSTKCVDFLPLFLPPFPPSFSPQRLTPYVPEPIAAGGAGLTFAKSKRTYTLTRVETSLREAKKGELYARMADPMASVAQPDPDSTASTVVMAVVWMEMMDTVSWICRFPACCFAGSSVLLVPSIVLPLLRMYVCSRVAGRRRVCSGKVVRTHDTKLP